MSVSADTIDESVTHSIPPEQPLSDVRLFQLHFRVIEKIGFGGEGSVFCVEDRVTHGKNALKIIHLTGKDEAALTKEAVLHSSFDHPNIVRFFFCWLEEVSVADAQRLQILDNDDGMDSVSYTESTFHHATNDTSFDQSYSLENSVESVFKGTYRMLFIQMEYFARGTLADELRNRVKVDRLANLRYIKDIAEGLSYLHEKGVVHRDIKPTNIFISDGGAVKIGDFGLAEARIAADGSESECPTECHMEGSPLYCSPEQARGKCNIDKYTDIFSLGVLAVELYCHFVTMHERIKVLTETKQQILPEEYIPSDYEEASLFLLMLSAEPSKRPDTRKVIRQISKLILSLEESEEEVVEKEEGSMFPATARPPYKNPKRDASFQQTSSPNKPSESIHPVSDAMEPYGPAPPPITYSEEDCDLGTIVADEILQHTTAAALTSHFVQSPVVK
ncbi:Protein kinase domain/Protein tyrosine kinase, putative [Angomonas deanei]|uniref:non-specific serine/threonine protein kinase n=1 Tax=Angomonas deanei TaxID=59799 RepID=A0A7G2C5J7_9TRYP|nr:Protein kinase domain/Protein tyrosine kinase, putative [Angomonas deanei]